MEPEGSERIMSEDDLIVTKTDKKGWITYCNKLCSDIAEYPYGELVGKPHSIIRSRAMPRCVFKLLWDNISNGREVFAYVVNRTKNNNHYWVLAHVTPSFDENGTIVGFHSNRRKPFESALDAVKPLYKALLEEETRHGNRKQGLVASTAMLNKVLKVKGVDYDEFVLSL
ncbi:putative sensor (PAS) domain for methyl-accepting chemotaxis sensory transducer [hydrothermal vent metagenome]|uniref:Putative sensor (PAS) domain for methyl-accepting chemotaxis sensory transducer n=1 Tax=hydrothermal vent metagenome TaxID=652676 RepID=A0A3B0TMY2_9ZZZZ